MFQCQAIHFLILIILWETFYAREALGIKTWDLYKYVMNAFSGEMAGLLALGGDDNVNPNSGPKANRFSNRQ